MYMLPQIIIITKDKYKQIHKIYKNIILYKLKKMTDFM